MLPVNSRAVVVRMLELKLKWKNSNPKSNFPMETSKLSPRDRQMHEHGENSRHGIERQWTDELVFSWRVFRGNTTWARLGQKLIYWCMHAGETSNNYLDEIRSTTDFPFCWINSSRKIDSFSLKIERSGRCASTPKPTLATAAWYQHLRARGTTQKPETIRN